MKCCNEEKEWSGFSAGQIFVGFLAGAAAGAVAAILTTPRSGEQTRTRIRALAEDSKERAHRLPEALAEASDAAKQAFIQTMAEGDRYPKHG